MADINLRFGIYTEDEAEDMELLSRKLPQVGLNSMHRKGEKSNLSNYYKESSIGYVYPFASITSLEEVNDYFVQQWKEYQTVLKKLLDGVYEAYLLYEFDMDNSDVFPAMIYEVKFLKFLADTGIELQLYYYPM